MAGVAWIKDIRVWLPVTAILITLLGGAYFVLIFQPSPWQPATVAYDSACKRDCQKLSDRVIPHVGPIKLMVQPKVDDEIAQWGDCLQSVANCMFPMPGAINRDVRGCIAKAACPQSCKERFTSASAGIGDFNKQLDVFETVFVNPGAPCAAPSQVGER